jgi:hypothetical protein
LTSIALVWILCGLLAVLVGMTVVLIVARSLDGSQAIKQDTFAAKLDELADKAAKQGKASGGSGWVSGVMAQSLATLATASRSGNDDPEIKEAASDSQKQIKSLITGLVIAGGVILAIIGALVGDGS